MAQPTKTPIDQGIIDRVVRGVKYVVQGGNADAWFGPQQPLAPFAQEQAKGRQFDFQTGYNVNIQPRHAEPVSYAQLRGLADNLDLLRLVIETRKDLMCKLKFEFKPLDPKKQSDARCEELQQFFRFPDQEHTWDEWLRMILEDLFVIDAPTIYPRPTLGGDLYALEPIDGATITRKIDGTGRTPQPPEVAYQQIIKGVPAVDYSRDELIYKPRNLRTNRIYGFSPVEQILMTVNIAMRRQVSQLQYYTDGSTPDLIMSLPEAWNPDQVKQFKDWWDSMLAGNSGARRGTMFVPNGVNPVNTKDGLLKDGYDEWLARIICYAFSLPVQALIKDVNRATAETAQDAAKEEGLAPVMQWVKGLVDYIVWKYFGYQDLQMVWVDEKAPNPLEQAQVNKIYVDAGVKLPNEVREEIGLDALTPDQEAEMAAKKAKAMQDAMSANGVAQPDDGGGGNPPPKKDAKAKADDTAKGEGLEPKKAMRELAPLNRQRSVVILTVGRLTTHINDAFKGYAKTAAAQLVAAYSSLTKDDKPSLTPDEVLASLQLDWPDLVDVTSDLLVAMAVDGASMAAAQIQLVNKQALDLAFTRAEDYARNRAAEMVGKKWVDGELVDNPNAAWRIDESTRTMLRVQVTNAIEEGWSNDQLANAIEESHAFSQDRAALIARTETQMADIAGNVAAYEEANDAGVEVWKKWITANDDRVSPDCVMNGKADPMPMGNKFPSGVMQPPDHPRCRCDISPVLFTDLVNNP